MKRYAFPLTIILLLFAVIALAAPGDKHPAVTSAAIGLGTSSSPTLASVTATTSVTAPAYNSTAADGYHYVLPYNSTAFAGTPSVGMIQTTPTGPQWYTGSAWEAIGSGGGGTWGSITGTLADQTDLQTALNAKASTSYVDTAIAGVTAGTIPFVSDTTPPSAENTINYSRSDHKFRFRYPNGDVYASAAMTLETAADTTPATFAFTDVTDAALSTVQTATPVQITGINYPTAVTASGGTAAICTGATADTCGTFSASPGNVALNQYVSAQHTSSASNSTAVDTTVTIGGVSDTFTSTTIASGWTDVGFNFRNTAGFVTDGASETYVLASTTYSTSGIGATYGFTSANASGADSNAGLDRRLAGTGRTLNGTPKVFRIDLPTAGTYRIYLALGDSSASRVYQYLQLRDGDDTTALLTLDYTTGSNGTTTGKWYDAVGTLHASAAAWASSNAYVDVTFTGTTAYVHLGMASGGTGYTTLSHFRMVRQ